MCTAYRAQYTYKKHFGKHFRKDLQDRNFWCSSPSSATTRTRTILRQQHHHHHLRQRRWSSFESSSPASWGLGPHHFTFSEFELLAKPPNKLVLASSVSVMYRSVKYLQSFWKLLWYLRKLLGGVVRLLVTLLPVKGWGHWARFGSSFVFFFRRRFVLWCPTAMQQRTVRWLTLMIRAVLVGKFFAPSPCRVKIASLVVKCPEWNRSNNKTGTNLNIGLHERQLHHRFGLAGGERKFYYWCGWHPLHKLS